MSKKSKKKKTKSKQKKDNSNNVWSTKKKICIGSIVFVLLIGVVLVVISASSSSDDYGKCTPDWNCSEWSNCNIEGEQTRTCLDLNQCNPTNIQKTEIQNCGACEANWDCSEWSECSISGVQTRSCLDLNNCANPSQITVDRPCEPSEIAIKEAAIEVTYDELMRHNENYVGEVVYYRGEVTQVMERSTGFDLRIYITNEGRGFWSDAVYVHYEGPRVLKNDLVKVWGEVKGLKTYTSIWGNEITIPEIGSPLILEVSSKAGDR